ncbi:MAG: MMPL family transporter [Sinimarinibacterium sp.]
MARRGANASRWTRLVADRPWLVLLGVAATSLVALALLRDPAGNGWRLRIDPSLDALIVPGIPAQQNDAEVRRRFGAREQVIVVVRNDDVFRADTLRRIHRLSRDLFDLPGVARVQSLTTVSLPAASGERLEFASYDARAPADGTALERLRAAARANPLVHGHLVSTDDRAAAIVVELEDGSDEARAALDLPASIVRAADAAAGPGLEVHVTGGPVLRAATGAAVLQQLHWVVPAIAVLVITLLAFAFRSLRGVVLPLLTLAVALLGTLAAFAVLGRPLNLVTSLVPTLVATMSLAYCAHVISEFEALVDEKPGAPRAERIRHLMRQIAAPVALTAFTTAVGLAALGISDLPAIREFALLSVLGVVLAAALALSLVPAALAYAVVTRRRRVRSVDGFGRLASYLGGFDVRNRKAILVTAVIVLAVSVGLSTRIRIGDQFIGVFEPDARVRIDYEAVNRALGGVTPLTILVDGYTPGVLAQPEVVTALDRLQQWLVQQPEVGGVTGMVDHLRVLSRTLGHDPAMRLPDSAARAEQLLFFGDSAALRQLLNADRSATLIRVRLTADQTHEVADLLDRLRTELATLPAPLEARIAGDAAIITESVNAATSGQLQSIALALLLIYACLALQFTSWRVGLLVSLPTLLQTAIYFGALGLGGITLNATTSLVECLVLGLAIDDTIHYLARFGDAARRRASETQGAVVALRAVLRPITLTKAILGVGFVVLVLGDLHNQVVFGWLAALTLFAAWLVDIFVTPAFMSGVRIVTLWDSLRVNLGDDVQRTIPLLQGLSPRQARVFALMANLRTVPSGTRLMTEGEPCGADKPGDPAGDIYVVVDGTLEVWIEREGSRQVISRLTRGAVVGEIGYFGQRRTANVDTLTSARLLRFDDADQERICRQYPRVASRVFLNLNRLQAERRASQAHQTG